MIIMNWIPIGLNWTILFKCLEMTIVVIWRYINKTELNWVYSIWSNILASRPNLSVKTFGALCREKYNQGAQTVLKLKCDTFLRFNMWRVVFVPFQVQFKAYTHCQSSHPVSVHIFHKLLFYLNRVVLVYVSIYIYIYIYMDG